MAHLTDGEREKLRERVSHRVDCMLPECPHQREPALWEDVALALSDLDQADENARDLVAETRRLGISVDNAREAEDDVKDAKAELERQLEAALTGDADTRALIEWAYGAGAELPDLRCSAGTYDMARLALHARGGPACSNYETKGKLDLCKCGKTLREHKREVVGA